MIRYNTQKSNYFQGVNAHYGRYQWNVKRYDWESEHQIELARLNIIDALRYAIKDDSLQIDFAGRSGGWLVINSPLNDDNLRRIDRIISQYHKTKISKVCAL